MLDILLAIVGIAVVIWGADRLTSGAVGIAERMRIPQLIIGLTIVAMGTSAPELFVSLVSSLAGTPDMAVGNVVGSNIFNILVIVGVTALVAPMAISRPTVRRDLPVCVISGILFGVICIDGEVSRLESAVLFVCFITYLVYTIREGKKGAAATNESEAVKPMNTWLAIFFIIIGLGCLVGGGYVFVLGATGIAKALGVSDAVIGLTIVAGGTSLPELATSVVAARKGNSEIAIGNVIGSNIFNILMIIGLTGIITPMNIVGVTIIDIAVMVLSGFLLWMFCYTKYTVERWEGFVMTAAYVTYIWWLIHCL